MLGKITRRLRSRIGKEPRTDGGVQASTVSRTASTQTPGIPPDDRRCPNGCDAETAIVSREVLLESEDTSEWAAGNDLRRRGLETAGRCRECGEVHTNTAPRQQ